MIISFAIVLLAETIRLEPVYPEGYADNGLEARCSVVYDVDIYGAAENICARCETYPSVYRTDETDAAFEAATRELIQSNNYFQSGFAGVLNRRVEITYALETNSDEFLQSGEPASACPERLSQIPDNTD